MTAVEWLFNELCSEKLSWNKDSNGKLFIDLKTSKILNQALDFEKQQIFDARKNVIQVINSDRIVNHSDYYETIKSATF